MRTRYTSWDGTQKVILDAEPIFDRLAEHLAETGDLSEALSRLLGDGVAGEDFEAVGAEELADQVRAAIQELYDRFNLSRSLEGPWNDLDDVVAAEEDAAARGGSPAEAETRRRRLGELSRVLEDRLAELGDWPFADADAKDAFDRLAERSGDLSRVERFQRRFREQFQGPDALDFDGTLSMIDRFEQLRRLEKALRDRNLEALDEAAASGLLGAPFAGAISRLKQMMQVLVDAGYVIAKDGRPALTPKAARRMGRLALKEMLSAMLPDASGRHDTSSRGPSEAVTEQAREYEYGDPMNIDVVATLRAALTRQAREGEGPRSPGRSVSLDAADLHVKESQRNTRTSTVLLLDMSWSMSWEGRFAAAKKVALAMETLMRTRYPRDYFGMVGFYTRAVELKPADLAEVTWNMGDPFTNLQDGLRVAGSLLDRHPAATRQMIVITDGQPTAYFRDGRLVCEWPMGAGGISSRATVETLKEVERVTRKGVRINTFMLDDSPLLRAFVQKMTAINRGRAFYTTPSDLGHFVMVDHVGRKRKAL